MKQHSCKMAILDISDRSNRYALDEKNKLFDTNFLINDVDGILRQPTKEESIHRSWNRRKLRDSKRLLDLGL